MIEPEMLKHLADTGDVFFLQAAFPTSARVHLYLKVAPQKATTPYCVLFKVSPGRQYTHDGHSMSNSRMQVSCFADDYRTAKLMVQQIKKRMKQWPATEEKVDAVFLAGEVDLFEDRTYHVALDFTVWHKY